MLPIIAVGLGCLIPVLVRSHPNDIRITGLGYPLIGLCVVAFPCVYLGYRNIRVAIKNDRIISTNILGLKRIDCSVHDVIPGSFKKFSRYSTSPPENYQIQTTGGAVDFDAAMRNSAHLAARLEAISDGVAPPAHPTAA